MANKSNFQDRDQEILDELIDLQRSNDGFIAQTLDQLADYTGFSKHKVSKLVRRNEFLFKSSVESKSDSWVVQVNHVIEECCKCDKKLSNAEKVHRTKGLFLCNSCLKMKEVVNGIDVSEEKPEKWRSL